MNFLEFFTFAGISLAIVLAVIPLILKVSRVSSLLQRANDLHHTHTAPVPRLGGLALAAAFVGGELIALAFYGDREPLYQRVVMIVSSLAVFLIGFWDDIRPLGAKRKLVAQVLVAVAVYASGFGITTFKIPFGEHVIQLQSGGFILTILWLVGMTNLINLVDGVDGLAGGICLMLMLLLAYVGSTTGSFGLLTSGMAGALLGFLWYNFPPARIYLGDGGAYFLGFQIGLVSLMSSHKGTVAAALVAPLFVLALPILDTSIAIIRRGLKGLPIFRADRRHVHHHLMSTGLSRRQVVISLYGITLVFLLLGFTAFLSNGRLLPSLLGIAMLVLLVCAGRFKFSREWFAVGRVVGNSLGMRQEIRYALGLTRWLALEGERSRSADDLWRDLVFAGRKLGFHSIKLTLRESVREWNTGDKLPKQAELTRRVQAGECGSIEFKHALCHVNEEDRAKEASRCGKACPCLNDRQLSEILAELLTEGWMKAARKYKARHEGGLTFDTGMAISESNSPLLPEIERATIESMEETGVFRT